MKKVKCSRCGNYINEDELADVSLCNGQCWIDICKTCVLIVNQEILDIFENNCEITGYFINTEETSQKQLLQMNLELVQ